MDHHLTISPCQKGVHVCERMLPQDLLFFSSSDQFPSESTEQKPSEATTSCGAAEAPGPESTSVTAVSSQKPDKQTPHDTLNCTLYNTLNCTIHTRLHQERQEESEGFRFLMDLCDDGGPVLTDGSSRHTWTFQSPAQDLPVLLSPIRCANCQAANRGLIAANDAAAVI